ncbi:O-acetylhomoserine aminocarboxypropyltransferase/cysteine synthase family protein [Rhodospirillum rubrum]|uniref:O-acetylhomoserine/O-acetylserine sulfhydrylase n=1 Tax=Rhodospirillum rubrum (strain ATCC 11170 / ATH 1.1.1 / DSM 467 / LMG 4362 / NCIMB 8255 / S1) TaxID=269796 RepID=Q2RWB7_RHORT|nr:PLP-dependent transferase [Rhodospirillum rubrum]ABC21578.1 O-acetylhomoserine/O-acetylserine sulfhydrylase [Rhodospirillum rubrum ATCC 11170]AEO47264.1 O-acetylhomoserine/O-acetylserine sulfhydrylase [Rhodospirillum rubrum F11]MBK5955810.1 O-acetylhomoserine aminocarboxypropyltransferase [Rhodospirillum rubrum]QXG81248.1 PLP-dependent transferase [Rhodospirillum rubrum]HAP98503.1 O-acetylhomoserine aminocarboxypropyltransferase [Rhodospirillum rubrum]
MTVDVAPPKAAQYHQDTLALHGGSYRADPTTGAVAVPIYQTTSYQVHDTAHAARLAGLEEIGFAYTRIGNPTQDAFEQRLAALEGGVAALALASGQAASAIAVLTLAQAGDNIVTSTDLYGGTWNLFANTLRTLGIEARFVDPADPEAFRRATDARTRLYYGETLPNPKLTVFPIAEVAAIGRSLGVPLIIDNTATPLIARPFDHGAAVVVYSTTKYIGGHGTTIGGAIIDGGTFPWADHAERHALLTGPEPSYHNASWTDLAAPFGPLAYILRARAGVLRDLGASIAPVSAFNLIQGLETLPLRLARHNANAIKVADYLASHPKVSSVTFPGLQSGEARRRADAYLKGGYGGLIGFELAGGEEAGRRFIEALRLFYHVFNIGDARSLAIHPATTTHSQLSPEDQRATGVTPGFVRLSIGIEHPDDIIGDIAQALDLV